MNQQAGQPAGMSAADIANQFRMAATGGQGGYAGIIGIFQMATLGIHLGTRDQYAMQSAADMFGGPETCALAQKISIQDGFGIIGKISELFQIGDFRMSEVQMAGSGGPVQIEPPQNIPMPIGDPKEAYRN